MSGIEIVGVLLGSFPLIISGLEHYRDAAEVAGSWWQIRTEHSKCLKDVEYRQMVYRQNLKELLPPVVHDTVELDRLIENPGGQRWSDPLLHEWLKSRLQTSYGLYIHTVSEMNKVAESLKKELCLDKISIQEGMSRVPGKKQSQSATLGTGSGPRIKEKLTAVKFKLDFGMFRTKFSFNKVVRNNFCSQLEAYNRRLEKILSLAAVLPPAPASGAQIKTSALEKPATRLIKS